MALTDIMTADATAVFLQTTDFAQALTLYPGNDGDNPESFTGVVFREDEEGTRQVLGDGVVLNTESGKRLRRSIRIQCLASVGFDDTRRPADVVKINATSEICVVKRILGRDADMMSVLCIKVDKVTEAYAVRKG